jgi:hypothetical protein
MRTAPILAASFLEMRDAGYRRTLAFEFLPRQSFQIFEPRFVPATSAATADQAGE